MMKWKPPYSNKAIEFTLRSVRSGLVDSDSLRTFYHQHQRHSQEQPNENGGERCYWQLFVLRDSTNYVFYDWIEFSPGDLKRHRIEDGIVVECQWDPAKKIFHPPPSSLLTMWGAGWSGGKGGWQLRRFALSLLWRIGSCLFS